MKIAILTLPLHTNYGGILQAYALQSILEKMGHEVDVLHNVKISSHKWWVMPLVYGKRMILKAMKDRSIPIFAERRLLHDKKVIEKYTSRFIDKHINLRKIKSLRQIKKNDYDAIVVGSDQIWRSRYFKSAWHTEMKDAFLNFTKGWGIRRISYAASFGLDNLNEYSSKEVESCRQALKAYNSVSVREKSGIALLKEIGIKSIQVLDPTLLLDKEDYLKLLDEDGGISSKGDLFCYILDRTPYKEKVISTIAKERELQPFFVGNEVSNSKLPLEKRIQPPVEDWLRGFRDAKFIVTDSFHACVFSIIFGKPFVVIGNDHRGLTRFTSLLSLFGLEDRMLLEGDKIDVTDIDNSSVESELNNNRMFSEDFLRIALEQ